VSVRKGRAFWHLESKSVQRLLRDLAFKGCRHRGPKLVLGVERTLWFRVEEVEQHLVYERLLADSAHTRRRQAAELSKILGCLIRNLLLLFPRHGWPQRVEGFAGDFILDDEVEVVVVNPFCEYARHRNRGVFMKEF